jgi:uncharacterized protein YjbI with pentapeptide repeats
VLVLGFLDLPAPMARLRAEDVLKRFAAGERDFCGADLQGLRFRRACLAGADFSGADLRGTDFLEADLRGAKFVGARCGLPFWRSLAQVVIALGAGLAVGSLQAGFILWQSMEFDTDGFERFVGATGSFVVDSILFFVLVYFAWEGLNQKGLASIGVAGAIVGVVSAAGNIGGVVDGSLAINVVGAVGVAVAVAGTGAIAATGAAVGLGAVAVAVIFTVAFVVILIAINPTGLCLAFISYSFLSLGLAFWRSKQLATGYCGARGLGVILFSLGGTRFSGADLRGAFFTKAQLKSASFASSRMQVTRIERVCWHGAFGLDHASLSDSILAESRTRKLLVSLAAPGADLRGLSLRGAYIPQADLRGVDFREVNLCDALLEGAHLEKANLKGSQCLGTNFEGAHLTGATLESWNIDHTTNLRDVDCAYVYLLEPLDAQGQRRDDHRRERLSHDPDKTFGPGDFEAYFKHVIEEVKLLIKNGVDAKAFQAAFQEVMRLHPQITPESLTGIKRMGNDVLATLQVPAEVDKGEIERDFFAEYNAEKLSNAKLSGLLEGERRMNDQLADIIGRLVPPTPPPTTPPPIHVNPIINVSGNHTNATQNPAVNNTTIHAGDGNLINTGSLNTEGGMVNLGDLRDQARIAINALPDQRLTAEEPTLRELLQQLQASLDGDTEVPESTRAEALSEIHTIAKAAQDPKQNASLARRAVNALKGISASVAEANKALDESSKFVATVKKVLPFIAAFFMG